MALEDNIEYQLYVNYHYDIRREQSLTPVYTKAGMYFPSTVKITKKKLNVIQKLRYYFYDFLLYIRKGQVIYDNV